MIRLGVIGSGAVVQRIHWPVLERMSRLIRIVAVASKHPQNARNFASMVGSARVYDDYHGLLEDPDVDAVLTAVPIHLNGSVLIDAVRAGKHVMAEKPICATPAQGRRILRECSKARTVVAVGENFRYRRDILRARDLIASGKIGTPFAFQLDVKFDLDSAARRIWVTRGWRRNPRHRGGFLLDAGVHPVAALREIAGDVSELSAHVSGRGHVLKGDDTLLMQVKLANGAVGQCFFCYSAKQEKEIGLDFIIYGTKGAVRVTDGTVTLTRGVGLPPKVYQDREFDRGYPAQWKNFCSAIIGQVRLISTPEKAFGDLVVINAALRSAASGRSIRMSGQNV
jgi:predicted dehydrogenase